MSCTKVPQRMEFSECACLCMAIEPLMGHWAKLERSTQAPACREAPGGPCTIKPDLVAKSHGPCHMAYILSLEGYVRCAAVVLLIYPFAASVPTLVRGDVLRALLWFCQCTLTPLQCLQFLNV